MFLATQYYRPPFPQKANWKDDISAMRDAGLSAVQLWAVWGWIESEPGVFNYDDYDKLITLADKKGLDVVLSTIAEIHPFWIHRLAPDAHMIDHRGAKVQSFTRCECIVGLTPGACFDHPRVSELMGGFLGDIASRYAGAKNLIGWDCWNETRWNVSASGFVCHCEHTLASFRKWLSQRHGGLDGLNKAWARRYSSWGDVYPGREPKLLCTESVEFLRFITWRAAMHTKFRYDTIRASDPKTFISAHCGQPAIKSAGFDHEQALCRGVDSDLADQLDGYGSSHFPAWENIDASELGTRMEAVRSACQGKPTWVSELQGAGARHGVGVTKAVPGDVQQRWVFQGMARNAKGVIFWCWSDEKFGSESSGFGISGWDGQAASRIAAMKKTAKFIKANEKLIDDYKVDPPRIGVLFTPDNYLLNYSDSGTDDKMAADSVIAYARLMERIHIPYEIVEARHLDVLDTLDVLVMPWSLIVPKQTRQAIVKFLKRGGRILIEAECDAFDEQAIYRHPDKRPFMKAMGVHDLGRRKLEDNATLTVELGEQHIDLPIANFATPLKVLTGTKVLAVDEHDQPLMVRRKIGQGAAYILGSFAGRAYFNEQNEELEKLIQFICDDASVRLDIDVQADDGMDEITWRLGRSGKTNMLWLINDGDEREVTVTDQAKRFSKVTAVTELLAKRKLPITDKSCNVELPAGGCAVLCW